MGASPRIARRTTWPAVAAVATIAAGTLLASAPDEASPADTAPPVTAAAPSTTTWHDEHHRDVVVMRPADRIAAQLATAVYQDVAMAEKDGYTSTLETLGCFQDPARGGMGVHYLDEALMDATVEIGAPEALVYELDADGDVAGLVAHEYIVPVDAWTEAGPPELFGVDFHRHPTLPLWVLHTWLWKDDPGGVFADWNPAVRMCPADVPIFGVDLPREDPPATTPG